MWSNYLEASENPYEYILTDKLLVERYYLATQQPLSEVLT